MRHEVPELRASWSYFVRRCYGEGLSKAHLRRVAGARNALSAERRYLVSVIPSGVLRSLVALRLRRAMALIAGVAITAAGFLVGSITRRTLDRIRRPGGPGDNDADPSRWTIRGGHAKVAPVRHG